VTFRNMPWKRMDFKKFFMLKKARERAYHQELICVVMLCSPYNCLKLSCVASLDLRNRWSRFLVDDEQEEQREETN